ENQSRTRILVIPSTSLETPHYEIQSLSTQDGGTPLASFEIVHKHDDQEDLVAVQKVTPIQQAAVQAPSVPQAPAPTAPAPLAQSTKKAAAPKKGLLATLLAFFGFGSDIKEEENEENQRNNRQRGRRGQGRNQRGNNRGGRDRNDRDRNDRDRSERSEKGEQNERNRDENRSERKQEDGQQQGRGRGRGRGNQQGRQRPVDDEQRKDVAAADTSVETEQVDAAEGNGENRRRRGDRRPRNTTKRQRGPHPDAPEALVEGAETVEAADAP